jgi:tripartite-type tricarboxylate transporter receptor subunit TctC
MRPRIRTAASAARVSVLALLLASTLLPAVVFAQAWPVKPIRLIVPGPAGGGTDILGRMVAEGLSRQLGQAVIVDNRGGGAGMIGTEVVAKAPADGHTLLMAYAGVLTVNPALFKVMPYDPIKDFAPVAMFARVPAVLVVHPSLPVKSIADLVRLARSKPRALDYASSGNGTSGHLCLELLKQVANIDIVHIPYKGGAPAMADVLGGQVPIICNNLVEILPQVKAGRMRALGISALARSSLLPDVPAIAETYPGFEADTWFGVIAPAGTPAPIVDRLNESVRQIKETPAVKSRLLQMGAEAIELSPAEFGALIRKEMEKWGRVVASAGIRPE